VLLIKGNFFCPEVSLGGREKRKEKRQEEKVDSGIAD